LSLTLLELFKVTTTVATSRRATAASLIVFDTFILLLLLFEIDPLVRHFKKTMRVTVKSITD
jgi:hypothetical protein